MIDQRYSELKGKNESRYKWKKLFIKHTYRKYNIYNLKSI